MPRSFFTDISDLARDNSDLGRAENDLGLEENDLGLERNDLGSGQGWRILTLGQGHFFQGRGQVRRSESASLPPPLP